MRDFLFRFALICVVCVTFATAQKVDLTVDLSKPGAKIDRNILGQFAEHLGNGTFKTLMCAEPIINR